MLKTSLSVLLLFCSLCGAHSLDEGGDEQGSSIPQHPQQRLAEGEAVQGSISQQQCGGAGDRDLRCIENSFQLVINLRDEVRELRHTMSNLRSHVEEVVSSLKSQLEEQRKQGNNNSVLTLLKTLLKQAADGDNVHPKNCSQ